MSNPIKIDTPEQFKLMQEELEDTTAKFNAEKAKDEKDKNIQYIENLQKLMFYITKALWSSMSNVQKIECSRLMITGKRMTMIEAIVAVTQGATP